MKIVIVLIAVLVLAWLVFGFGRRSQGRPAGRDETRRPGSPPKIEGMVSCAHCGVHLPASEAMRQGALHYCGDAHRQAGPRPPDGA
jgi:uncharacterized protein